MSKEATMKSLRSEVRTLNESLETEKQTATELHQEVEMLRIKLRDNTNELTDAKQTIESDAREISLMKHELASLQAEQSQTEADRQKQMEKLKTENERSMGQLFSLQEQVRELQSKLSSSELELVNVQTEFASYKVRAQSVLRQNKSKDSSAEEELKEEIELLTKSNEGLKAKLAVSSEQNRQSNETLNGLRSDKQNLHERCKKLIELLDEVKEQVDQLQSDNRRLEQEHQEALKGHRIQIDTLNNCYKAQIDELKQAHEAEVKQLRQSRAGDEANGNAARSKENASSATLTNEQRIELILTERQSGEGSESIGSIPHRKTSTTKNRRELIPLDELLSTSFEDHDEAEVTEREQDVNAIKEKLTVQQRRWDKILVKHRGKRK